MQPNSDADSVEEESLVAIQDNTVKYLPNISIAEDTLLMFGALCIQNLIRQKDYLVEYCKPEETTAVAKFG